MRLQHFGPPVARVTDAGDRRSHSRIRTVHGRRLPPPEVFDPTRSPPALLPCADLSPADVSIPAVRTRTRQHAPIHSPIPPVTSSPSPMGRWPLMSSGTRSFRSPACCAGEETCSSRQLVFIFFSTIQSSRPRRPLRSRLTNNGFI
jgi:hypothetical protein